MEEDRLTLTVKETAKQLGCSKGKMYELIRQELIPHLHLGARRIVVPKVALYRMLEAVDSSGKPWEVQSSTGLRPTSGD
ncbi:helix-turn-helix domain-containing protein [Chloroflexota bacterium]